MNNEQEKGERRGAALIAPHGGRLVDRRVRGEAALELLERAARLPRLVVTLRQVQDAYSIGIGAFSPLEGFMDQRSYTSVLQTMHLPSGAPWPLPVVLPVKEEFLKRIKEEVALIKPDGVIVAVVRVQDVFAYDKEQEARLAFGTTDPSHPGVAVLKEQGTYYLAGPIDLLTYSPAFPHLPSAPDETRSIFAQKGWRRVAGFQTRNPVHRAHEHLQKVAMELVDGLFLHPLVGETKEDDLPAAVRIKAYETLLAHYYPADRAVLGTYPAAMRYAGPREAVLHALVRKNYGCSHFIVGRDHAGVGGFYGPYDAHRIFDKFDREALGIIPLLFDDAFYCRTCGGMASSKTCPHAVEDRVVLSGTKLRAMLQAGELPPAEVVRPEVGKVLLDFFTPRPSRPLGERDGVRGALTQALSRSRERD